MAYTPRKQVALGGVFSQPDHVPPPLPENKKPLADLIATGERLSQLPKPGKIHDAFPVSPRNQKSAADIEESVTRLHDQAMEKKTRLANSHEKEIAASSYKSQQLSEADIQAHVQTLYDQAMEKQRTTKLKLEKKYRHKAPESPRVSNAAVASRLYDDSVKKQKETHDLMLKKYVDESLPKYKKMTPEEIKTSGTRLTAKNSL